MKISQLDKAIISNRETSVNNFVRYMPNPCMDDQVNAEQRLNRLKYKRKWYQVW